MTNLEFVEKIKKFQYYNTQYATGAFGAICGLSNNRERYAKNSKPATAAKIMKAPADAILADCICCGKGILWGFDFELTKKFGGAQYGSNGVPDFSIKAMHKHCSIYTPDGCKNPDAIELGEWLRTSEIDHVSYYVGDGMIGEFTQKGDCKFRIMPLDSRKWEGHGKILYLNYYNVQKGDVNGDGKIDARDYMLCKKIVLGTYAPDEIEKWAADVNNDGKVSALDYMRLKRMVLKNE